MPQPEHIWTPPPRATPPPDFLAADAPVDAVVLGADADEAGPGDPVPGRLPAAPASDAELLPEETVDGVPVIAEVRPLATGPATLPAVQAAAAAATGFVAGAATLALVRRHSARKLARSRLRRQGRPSDALPIVASRSFLVDVHLIAKPTE